MKYRNDNGITCTVYKSNIFAILKLFLSTKIWNVNGTFIISYFKYIIENFEENYSNFTVVAHGVRDQRIGQSVIFQIIA